MADRGDLLLRGIRDSSGVCAAVEPTR